MQDSEFDVLTTEDKLHQWGLWARTAGCYEVGFACAENKRSSVPVRLTDAQGLEVDAGLARLRVRDEKLAKIARLRYLANYSLVQLGSELQCGRDTARAYLLGAISWLDGYFARSKQVA